MRINLLPVVSLAWYLSTSIRPDSRFGKGITVWIVGAELVDTGNGGRLYRCLMPLLGLDSVNLQLIGPELKSGGAQCFQGRLDQYPDFLEGHYPDVAVLFQPGFEEHTQILGSGDISALLRHGCMIIGSSYSKEEYLRDQLMARAYGYELSPSSDNPYALDPADTGLHWGDQMWHFHEKLPADDFTPDLLLAEDVRRLSRMVAHSRLHGAGHQPAIPGYRFEAPDGKGGYRQMMHIMDGYYLDPSQGLVYGVQDGRLLRTNVSLSQDELQRIPQDEDPMLLALWAARIKDEYLMKQ
jgi:hypothetical protein